jgi:hypothetical protein
MIFEKNLNELILFLYFYDEFPITEEFLQHISTCVLSAIIWYDPMEKPEVINEGRPQGLTKKDCIKNPEKSRFDICTARCTSYR